MRKKNYYLVPADMPSCKSLLTVIISFLSLFCVSCRKTDKGPNEVKDPGVNSFIEERFFNTNRTENPVEKSLVNFIKKRNDKEHFVVATVKQIGYPRWDKAL